MLKVLHTGDWHIGSFPGPEVGGQNARFQDICRCLDFQAMYARRSTGRTLSSSLVTFSIRPAYGRTEASARAGQP